VTNKNKAKGSAAERAVTDHLNVRGVEAERVPAGATFDRGDIWVPDKNWPAIQVKNHALRRLLVLPAAVSDCVTLCLVGRPEGAHGCSDDSLFMSSILIARTFSEIFSSFITMPYYRRRGYGRRGYGRRRGGFSGMRMGTAWSLAKKAWSAAKYVRSLVNVEHKFCDQTQTSQVIGKALTIYPLNNIPQGTDYDERTGLSVKATSMFLRWSVKLDPAATLNQIRCIVFIDQENLGSTPTSSALLEQSGNYQSPLNHATANRFNILYDRTVTLDVNGKAVIDMKMFKKISLHLKYTDATATSYYNTGLYIAFISDNNTASPIVDFYHRLRYVDN